MRRRPQQGERTSARATTVLLALLCFKGVSSATTRASASTPCPCLNNTAKKEDIRVAVQKAWSEGTAEVRATAESAAAPWIARTRKAKARSADALRWARGVELNATQRAQEAEEERETELAQHMIGAVEAAWQRGGFEVNSSAEASAGRQARSQAARWLAPKMDAAAAEVSRLEESRGEASNLTEAATTAAKQMAEVSRQAEALATGAESHDGEGDAAAVRHAASLAQSVEEAEREALARAKQSERLSALAVQAATKAGALARSALRGGEAAEASAARALATARANALRLAALKRQAQLAEQRAARAAQKVS